MSNIIQHPRALEIVRKTTRAAEAAQEKAERAKYRKRLKETKPRRDAQKAWERRYNAASLRISWAANAGADAVANVLGARAAQDEAFFAILDAALAAEATAAKAAGQDMGRIQGGPTGSRRRGSLRRCVIVLIKRGRPDRRSGHVFLCRRRLGVGGHSR